MKRLVVIAGALLLVSGAAAGAYIYFAPAIDLAETLQGLHPGHAIAKYANVSDEKSASRKRTLQLVEELGGVQDRIIRGDHAAIAEQARLLSEIADVVRGFTPEDWSDYVKVRATFGCGGGACAPTARGGHFDGAGLSAVHHSASTTRAPGRRPVSP